MLFAISGPQGSGKTTILNHLHHMGFPIVERKSSRSLLNDMNVTLDQVNDTPELCAEFQRKIVERKWNDEWKYHNTNTIAFTERTFTDLFVYALVNLGKFNSYDQWINRYFDRCKYFNDYYTGVFHLNGGMFDIENDGVRGSNRYYGLMVDTMISTINHEMNFNYYYQINDIVDPRERTKFIKHTVKD